MRAFRREINTRKGAHGDTYSLYVSPWQSYTSKAATHSFAHSRATYPFLTQIQYIVSDAPVADPDVTRYIQIVGPVRHQPAGIQRGFSLYMDANNFYVITPANQCFNCLATNGQVTYQNCKYRVVACFPVT